MHHPPCPPAPPVPPPSQHPHDGKTECNTRDKRRQWYAWDLKTYEVAPTRYSLRHGNSDPDYSLRHWRLEGSDDGETWTTLSTHSDDGSLGGKGPGEYGGFKTASWELPGLARRFFRHFKIVQTGKNSSGYDHLWIAGFELYGGVRRM